MADFEDALAYMSTDNNDGEFLMCVERIEEAVARGKPYEQVARLYGIAATLPSRTFGRRLATGVTP